MLDLGTMVAKIKVDSGEANSELNSFGKTATSKGAIAKKALLAVSAVAIATAVAIKKLADQTAKYGDEVDKESQKMGISAKAYQEWGYVLERNGSSIKTLKTGMKTFTAQIEKGSSAFEELGVKTKDANGNYRETEDIMNDSIKALAGVEDKTKRAALASELFGKRTAQELAPALNSGAEGIKELQERAEELGFVMSEETVQACADYQDAMTDVQKSTEGLRNNLIAVFIPAMAKAASSVADAIGEMSTIIHNEVEEKGAAGLVSATVKIAGKVIKKIVELIPTLITKLADVITKLADSINKGENSTKMINAAVKMIGKLIKGIIKATPALLKAIWNLAKSIIKKFGEIDLYEVGKTIINSLFKGLKALWGGVESWIDNKASWIKKTFQKAAEGAANAPKHRIGLAEVPYDGYTAVLHKGETVLTAAETNQLASSSSGGTTINFNGNYTFRDREDINYFMNKAGAMVNRRLATI